jgi:heme-degrading monooxygenase HmoA
VKPGGVRVLLLIRLPAGEEPAVARAAVFEAYHRISAELSGTPGLLGNELLGSTLDPDRFAVLSEWEDRAAFQAWESGPNHESRTSPLRPFQDRGNGYRHYEIYEVVASY